jgi:hypothetical protein
VCSPSARTILHQLSLAADTPALLSCFSFSRAECSLPTCRLFIHSLLCGPFCDHIQVINTEC